MVSFITLLFSSNIIRNFLYKLAGKKEPIKSYGERLSELTNSLTKASSEVDSVLAELAKVAKDREKSVIEMEASLARLESKEKELIEDIGALQNIPIPVADQFAKLVASGEKRSSRRDYFLFIAGVVVTTIIAILLQVFSKN